LITDEQFEQLLANGRKPLMEALDLKPAVKIFLPHVRWLLVGLDAETDRVFYVVQVGAKQPEVGIAALSDIIGSRLGMLTPERDKYIRLDRPWPHYLRNFD
jgi:Protein of unknown function (DUF2958)